MYLEQVALIVDDYDDAIRFVVEVLGFELVEDSPSSTNDGCPNAGSSYDGPARPPRCCSLKPTVSANGARFGDQFAGRIGLFLRVDDFAAT